MTPTPPSAASSSNGAHSPDAQFRVVRKRNRVPLSCFPCRNRKLKCNRTSPCSNCERRGDGSSCSYAAPGTRKKNQSSAGSTSSDEMQNRIDKLEGLVLSLITSSASGSSGSGAAHNLLSSNGSISTGSGDHQRDFFGDRDMIKEDDDDDESDVDQVTNSFGVMKVDNNSGKTYYIGEQHWASVLSEVQEVKNYFSEHKKQFEAHANMIAGAKQGFDGKGPLLLFGVTSPPPRSEILASMPSKTVVDQLISRYFNSYDPAVHILHGPTFQKQYSAFWQEPSIASVIWIGQLYAIMTLAMQSYHRAGDEPPEYRGRALEMAAMFRKRTAECLVLADFTKTIAHTIETLILYLQGEYIRSRDTEVGVWLLTGMIVRLAMRMGYHRDPAPYPSISPFQGEMRRRVWTFVRQADLLFSFQIGLPSMIRTADCDTRLPSNIFDDEISEEMPALPPSRPFTDPTPVSYMLTKATISFTFGKIVEQTHKLTPLSYDEVMKLDQELHGIEDALPPHLRTSSSSSHDPAMLVMQRYNLSLLLNKAFCVLHRRFLRTRYTHSRRQCIESCMQLLRHQVYLDKETGPKGRLRSAAWYITSLTTSDFLLAAMIICLDLHRSLEVETAGSPSSQNIYEWDAERRREMMAAINEANEIWKASRDTCLEAYKASEVLTVMLTKLQTSIAAQAAIKKEHAGFLGTSHHGSESSHTFSPFTTTSDSSGSAPQFTPQEDSERPDHAAAMTLGMLQSGGSAFGSNSNDPTAFSIGTPGGTNITMNEPSGMTPNYLGAGGFDGNMMGASFGGGGASPFAGLWGGVSMDAMAGNQFDWDAWDSYVQGSSLDPNIQLWAPTGDFTSASTSSPSTQAQPQHSGASGSLIQQQQSPGSVFMGVQTPPNNQAI